MDRDEAVRAEHYKEFNFAFDDAKKTDLATYNDYMGRPQAASGLFSLASDNLTEEEVKILKGQFVRAQKNKSLMWQDVISFDNVFLEKYGLYDNQTGKLDDVKLKQAARVAVSDMLEREGMSESAVWSGAIHYNTDNIHIHVAIVEPEPTRPMKMVTIKDGINAGKTYRDYVGNRTKTAGRQSSYERFKSLVLSNIIDNSKKTEAISRLQREVMTSKNISFVGLFAFQTHRDYMNIFRALPNNKRLWRYRNAGIDPVRPQIKEFLDKYIEKNYSKEFKQYNQLLDEQVEYYRDAYGDSRADDYKGNKLYGRDGLYTHLGNELLKEMNNFDNDLKEKYGIKAYGKVDIDNLPKSKSIFAPKQNYSVDRAIKKIFEKTWEEKNREFEAEEFQHELEEEKEGYEI
jgi:hypothetical protein